MRPVKAILAAVLLTIASTAWCAYPEKPIEIFLPWPPGTETDVGTRVLAQAMSKRLGVPVQVINKPGGQGVIGTAEVAKARPDGYTLGQLNVGPIVSQVVAGNTPYSIADFVPIGLFNTQPYVLLGKGDAPYKSIAELSAYAKAASKEVAIGNFGPATVPTLTVTRISAKDGWKYRSVTFPSTSFSQIQSGDVDLIVVAYPVVASNIKSGQARALVAMTPKRIPALPDVPTVREAGYGFDVSIWSGLFAPKGTPTEVLAKLGAVLRDALTDPSIKDFEQKSGIIHAFVDPASTSKQMAEEEAWLRPVMEAAGLTKKK
jgi:tripartite-type tricarboxylate transporter receptor subunit TctC